MLLTCYQECLYNILLKYLGHNIVKLEAGTQSGLQSFNGIVDLTSGFDTS
jgi:hypothetical protein